MAVNLGTYLVLDSIWHIITVRDLMVFPLASDLVVISIMEYLPLLYNWYLRVGGCNLHVLPFTMLPVWCGHRKSRSWLIVCHLFSSDFLASSDYFLLFHLDFFRWGIYWSLWFYHTRLLMILFLYWQNMIIVERETIVIIII